MEKINRNKSCPNIVGYSKMWITTEEEVESITIVGANTRSYTFATGGTWGEVEATNISLSADYADGKYTVSVTADLTTGESLDAHLDELRCHRVLLRLKDRNGSYFLVGSLSQPLHFEYEHTNSRDEHVYHLRFTAETTQPLTLTI